MLKVAAYTAGYEVPSARFRVRQYIPNLLRLGVELQEMPARFGSYPPVNRALRPAWACATLAERFRAARGSRGSDVTLLQREMLSTFATMERFTKAPRVLDVDDAIWLLRDGRTAVALARLSDMVICGNLFIADFFSKHAPQVAILPTPVDTDRFQPVLQKPQCETRVVCWSGTSSGFPFLQAIEPALATVLKSHPARRLRIISDRPPVLRTIAPERTEFVHWSEDSEVEALRSADVAIMPLPDTAWARGKCSFKMLCYMSCGLPVVVSPVGMNKEVLAQGGGSMAARTTSEWVEALNFCLTMARDQAATLGAASRKLVEREYSLRTLSPRFAALLCQASEAAA